MHLFYCLLDEGHVGGHPPAGHDRILSSCNPQWVLKLPVMTFRFRPVFSYFEKATNVVVWSVLALQTDVDLGTLSLFAISVSVSCARRASMMRFPTPVMLYFGKKTHRFQGNYLTKPISCFDITDLPVRYNGPEVRLDTKCQCLRTNFIATVGQFGKQAKSNTSWFRQRALAML